MGTFLASMRLVLQGGVLGVLHGTLTWLLQNDDGQVQDTHSISAGLDYPAVGPEHALLHDTGRAQYSYATDSEALEARGQKAFVASHRTHFPNLPHRKLSFSSQ